MQFGVAWHAYPVTVDCKCMRTRLQVRAYALAIRRVLRSAWLSGESIAVDCTVTRVYRCALPWTDSLLCVPSLEGTAVPLSGTYCKVNRSIPLGTTAVY